MIRSRNELKRGATVVVPCYEEEATIVETVERIAAVLDEAERDPDRPFESEMIFVDDGSRDRTRDILRELAQRHPRLRLIENHRNCGYGASLKRGIAQARYDRLVITDADGTYPNERIPELVRELDDADMAVGARTGRKVAIPLLRKPAKWALLRYAQWMSRADIKDVNSGLRAIWTRHVVDHWSMLPDGFSFTTTLTLAMHVNRLQVVYVPIDYYSRVGKSSIRPIPDTVRFFSLVLRTVMYFKPLQVFGSLAAVLLLSAIAIGAVVRIVSGLVPDVIVVSLFSTGLIFLGLGLLGDLINARRAP